MMSKIVKTEDGSFTLFSSKFKEHYHSTYGALNESMLVYIENGLKYYNKKSINIFELGFGTGLNAILTYIQSLKSNLTINYHTIELYPLKPEIISELDYNELLSEYELSIFNKMHNSSWDTEIEISENFFLKKINIDFEGFVFNEKYDIIYFDAFAPDTQPNLWSTENFIKLYDSLNPKGIITTYSSKGIVKRNLRDAGFNVSRLPGPNGKRHVIRAEKN
jgi:tRNA U34 5-methylaminomethyl-2-thiouridine-forming methyltransferase MnmC